MKTELTPSEKTTVLMLLSLQEVYGIKEFIRHHGKKVAVLDLTKKQFPDIYDRIYNMVEN